VEGLLFHWVRIFVSYRGGCTLAMGARKDCVTRFYETVFKAESIVLVALGEPGVPLIWWAGAGRATSLAAASVSSDRPFMD
jgi:hypothetical protein